MRAVWRIAAALVVVALLLGAGAYAASKAYRVPGPLAEERVVVVPRTTLDQVASLMESNGVVANATALRLAALVTRGEGPVKAGEFAFPAGASLRDVLQVLRSGKPVQHLLTIPEGLTAAQVSWLVANAPALDGDTPVPAEGSILPESYAYEHGMSRNALLGRGAKAMDKALAEAWAGRSADTPLRSPHDALVLASIVERETAKPEERPRVAAVFLNRLRRGMRLQSDATVTYFASGGSGVLDHGLTRAELETDDPYNTYRNAGLPPGPISMPGAQTLRAVTHPADTTELYFVADGTGGHAFAKSEQQHQLNVAHWREVERQRAGNAQPAPRR